MKEGSKAIRHGIIISMDGHLILMADGQNAQGRQEIKWAKKIYIDIILNIDYRQAHDLVQHKKKIKELDKRDNELIILLANIKLMGSTI